MVAFAFSRALFLRLLGVVYLIAFVSLGSQIGGLVGSRGILPIGDFLTQARSAFGSDAYFFYPTLLWLWSSDACLTLLCWGGAALSLALIAGVAPLLTCVLLWAFYLSLTIAGQIFLEFQWDMLLLETGLLACLYAPLGLRPAASEPNPIVRWVLWSLVFKLTFLSGITKILSGDPTWAGWTALTYHYWTQPLPVWTSWYMQQLPTVVHSWSVPAMLGIELIAPFAVFLPTRFRKTRLGGCALMILLQLAIGATGNYGFFNLLSIALYLALLDDQTLRRLSFMRQRTDTGDPQPKAWRMAAGVAAVTIAFLSVLAFVREIEATARTETPITSGWAGRMLDWVSPLRSINGYGLFRVMTTVRPELVIQVSADAQDWEEYEFKWKPGNPKRRPRFVAPHMPRLDWQLWFAALDPPNAQYWLEPLMRRLLEGEPSVVRLMGPSPLTARPRIVRLAYYDYRFSTREERARSGDWWTRNFRGYLTSGSAP